MSVPLGHSTQHPKEAIIGLLHSHGVQGIGAGPQIETIQFGRSRILPGHQFHEVTFQNSENQTEGYHFLLCQGMDGTWSVIHYTGGPRTETTPLDLPKDRPWLTLAGSVQVAPEEAFPGGDEMLRRCWKIHRFLEASGDREKTTTFYQMFWEKFLKARADEGEILELKRFLDTVEQTLPEQHLTQEELLPPMNHFLIYGEVSDNGFDIVHVRLVSTNGIIFDDILQNGLVFFASHQKVIRPLQAKLYNSSGKLISQQTVMELTSIPPDARFGGMFRQK